MSMAPSMNGRPPSWVLATSLGLSLAAVGIASYLTVAQYADPGALACPDRGVVNCTLVTTSPESVVFGVPIALLGLVWAVAMLGLCIPSAWQSRVEWVEHTRLIATGIGAVTVVYLVYTELFRIGAICLWCSAMHVTAVALFGVVMAARAQTGAAVTAHG
jgi:uncharacterized membrane protein